ncbi:hypothetical protein QWY82_13505 [Simiduia curdlanivorans]|uniref:Uncharacterized protein n=1 Tax=Simiduia curdlanivorans TaxID=1492769 RepID=A0ABV8V7I4_9GAMM|nr:hypothetical protein [Simiduia curdlanivorans]MDN3639816.1 hypothetical protein [Simiduia curdlanivorans]
MAYTDYKLADMCNDLAALFGHKWVAIPLICLLGFKVVSLAPMTFWYLVPLLVLTLLFSIRATARLVLRDRALLLSLYQAQSQQRKR